MTTETGAPPKGAPVLALLAVLLAAVLIAVFGVALARPGEHLAVLVYHHIEEPARSDVSCTPTQFAEQMAALLADGFTPLRLEEVERYLAGLLPDVKRPVLITFDDGYESLYAHALPIAKRLRIPMTVFVVTSRIGRRPQFAAYLSEEQIREMAGSGFFQFGSHTNDLHTDLLRIWNAFDPVSPPPMALAVEADLACSRNRLTSLLGTAPVAIAWPYGKFNDETRGIAEKAGFTLHFTSRSGYNQPGDDRFCLRRVPVTCRDTPQSVVHKAMGGWL
ncbi:MAG TPA: polysaccharide deacetylase family protein [Candidatus Ozemobacteraceae bacterium]